MMSGLMRYETFLRPKKINNNERNTTMKPNHLNNESEFNQVICKIRPLSQASKSLECNSAMLAKILAHKALLFKNIAQAQLLSELDKIKKEESNFNHLTQNLDHIVWNQYALLKLYFVFNTHLTYLEKSSKKADRELGLQEFADLYAQTITYGLLSARWMSKNKTTPFSLNYIEQLLPSTSPFLRHMFLDMVRINAHSEITSCIKDLFSILCQVNLDHIFDDIQDPVIHFYEDFLEAYDKEVRKKRGVYYTPSEVVDFIVRSIDEQLKNEFDLPLGLASTQSWGEVADRLGVEIPDKRRDQAFVQILDPSTGTGIFPKRVLELIRETMRSQWKDCSSKEKQKRWKDYLIGEGEFEGKGLFSRFFGFELMMAPYMIAHLRLGMLLEDDYENENEMSFSFEKLEDQEIRLNVVLTDSLTYDKQMSMSYDEFIAQEAKIADSIKEKDSLSVILGNPPYNAESQNKHPWIINLMDDYKREPGTLNRLNEKNSKPINDDYMKFIRIAQHYLDRSSLGILGYINPHGFLDNLTFRGARWYLWTRFCKLYVIDLHGNIRKKEVCPDGSKDKGVFDIKQGVSINFFIKKRKSIESIHSVKFGEFFHTYLFGLRAHKSSRLSDQTTSTFTFSNIPDLMEDFNYLFMVPKEVSVIKEYLNGFSVDELFTVSSVGIVTSRDKFVTSIEKFELELRIQDFFDLPRSELLKKYGNIENKTWKLDAIKENAGQYSKDFILELAYRPFDTRSIYYDDNFNSRPRKKVMQHFLNGENLGLMIERIVENKEKGFTDIFITKNISDKHLLGSGTYIFPLYSYEEDQRFSNLNIEIIQSIQNIIGIDDREINEVDLFQYVYVILHSPVYRKRFEDFLVINFPRIPYPKNADVFWQLVEKGKELSQVHLLESGIFNHLTSVLKNTDGTIAEVSNEIIQYRAHGPTITIKEAEKLESWNDQIWINKTQYFDGVSELAWNFYIGGYQPAQKWIKDRKGRSLSADEVIHYKKIILALEETYRIMKEIDQINFL
jgi:predicted helicase